MTRWAVILAAIVGGPTSAFAEPDPFALPSGAPIVGTIPAEVQAAQAVKEPVFKEPVVQEHAPASSNPLAERLKPTFELRGRIQVDAVMAAQSAASQAQIGDLQNGYGFRRARLGAQGTVGTS